MRKILFFQFFFSITFFNKSFAQNALPHISLKNYNGKIIISWLNQYHRVAKSVYIQCSYDSLKDFSTIASMLYPENIENGYVDNKPLYKNTYYRVFVAFAGGSYVFSEVKNSGKSEPLYELNSGDSIAMALLKQIIKPHNNYIYIGRENNVIIELPDAEIKKYSIKFYDDSTKPIFELHKLTESFLTLEKVNFLHAGWYYYEIYENGKLVEKDRFYLPKNENVQPGTKNERGGKNN